MDDEPYQPIYFIGIALPDELNREVSSVKWQLYDLDKAMLKPLLPHVTLLHPPSLKGIMPSELIPRVKQVAAKYLPLTIGLEDIGFFGDRVGYIRANSFKLVELQSHLVKLLPKEAQDQHYKRDYLPHVTMAQIYDPKKLDKGLITQMIRDGVKLPQQFTVNNVACFQRVLPREYKITD